MGAARGSLEQRFWRFVLKTEDSCWLWTGHCKPSGHGTLNSCGQHDRPLHAHRVSWQIHCGAIPEGAHVLHKCDVARCVNPEHLYLGSHADNMRDRSVRGRVSVPRLRGELNGFSKLTVAQVVEIRNLYDRTSISQRKLAKLFGVSQPHIGRIVRGEVWAS